MHTTLNKLRALDNPYHSLNTFLLHLREWRSTLISQLHNFFCCVITQMRLVWQYLITEQQADRLFFNRKLGCLQTNIVASFWFA